MTPTIAAISTSPGMGAIAIVRVSGPRAMEIVQKVWHGKSLMTAAPRTVHLGYIIDAEGDIIDQVLATVFRSPASFTGEDMVEISCHGSTYLQRSILARLIDAGAQAAGPGEFSMRAVMNGRMDLAQAEGVADLIASTSRAAAQMAIKQMRGGISKKLEELTETLIKLAALVELELDFSEEDVEFASRSSLLETADAIKAQLESLIKSFATGTAIRDGIPVAIVGAPNAGKSSLLNALLDDERAIVSNTPGTTRDTIEDTLTLDAYLFRLTDTAGLRKTDDPIEQAGILRTHKAINRASIVLSIVDATETPAASLIANCPEDSHRLIILNKCDLQRNNAKDWDRCLHNLDITHNILQISTFNSDDISRLKKRLVAIAHNMQQSAGQAIITNERHRQSLLQASDAITRVQQALTTNLPLDMLTQDLRETIDHLNTITTAPITTPTLLHHLFAHFCIGK